MSSQLVKMLLATCFIGSTFAQFQQHNYVEFKAYSDSACKNRIQPSFDLSESSQGRVEIDMGESGWPRAKTFENATFPGTQTNSSAGSVVWWQVPKPDGPQCRYVLMGEWDHGPGNYGKIGVPQGYGKTVLDVAEAGCYYSSMPQGNKPFFWSYCCGSDCANYAANNTSLFTKREAIGTDLTLAGKLLDSSLATRRAVGSLASRVSSLVQATKKNLRSRDDGDDSDSAFLGKCTVVSKQGPLITSGQQVMVGNAQNCPASTSGTCTFSAASGTMRGTTITSSTDQTITNGFTASFSVQAGFDFIVDTQFTASGGYTFTDAVTKSTGQSSTNTTTFTFTNQITQYPGTNAFMSFIPSYQCFTVTVNCGGADSQPLDVCTTTDNQGAYQMVITS